MQIPIIDGIYTDNGADFRTSYPINLVPVPKQQGISEGYLRPADGIVRLATASKQDRGGINWNDICYRVLGDKFVKVEEDGSIIEYGTVVDNGKPVSMDYGFTLLGIASGDYLYYFDGTTLTQVTDPNIGRVLDMVWVDGYYMTTDGENLVVTNLADPYTVNPLKYGSSEADPDPIEAILKNRNEIYALNRYTIEIFNNVGGQFFPFARNVGAQIQKGAIGTHACCVFQDKIAFVGSGHNEQVSVYIGASSVAQKVGTREIDILLAQYSEAVLSTITVEYRNYRTHDFIYVHLPDFTLVFDEAASKSTGQLVWHILSGGVGELSRYPAQNFVYVYNKWICGNPLNNDLGYFDETISSQYGNKITWEFGTRITYAEGRGAIFHSLELVALTGRIEQGTTPLISTSYSIDGKQWSQERVISAGTLGQRKKRLAWRRQGFMNDWRIQKFSGDSDAFLSFARLEAEIEPLSW